MTQDLWPDTRSWAQDHFGGVELGRSDRHDRLLYSAACLAQQPGQSLPAVFDRKDLRCFYALMHRPESTHDALLQGHYAQTKQALNVPEAILLISDTTELDFSSHKALHPHLGPIGEGHGHGLLQHNCLAVRARDGFLLGLAHQQLIIRQPAPAGENSSQRQQRERESQLWSRGFAGVGRAPEGCLWVDVCDRGADVFEALHASRQLQHHALIRACQDRCVVVERNGQSQRDYLMQFARRLPAQCDSEVAVTQKGGRPARTAQVKLAAGQVRIEPPVHLPRRCHYEAVSVWVERIWEPQPPAGEEALEWVLLSTLPTQTDEELLLRRDWYALRWPTAEDYHQAEKTGCGEEKVRFQDGHALRGMLALLSVVAVRVLQLRQAGRSCPQEPVQRVATPLEISVLHQALAREERIETVGQFVHGVARLGGWLGRRCDGEPGWKTLWRGYRRLQDMVEGVLLYQQIPEQGPGRKATATNTKGHPHKPP